MAIVFLLLTIILLGKITLDIFQSKGKEFEFPFLIGLVYIGWLLPQAIALSTVDYFPDFAVARFMIGMFLSLLLIWIGWNHIKVKPFFKNDLPFSNSQLKWICFFYSISGTYFFYKLSQWMSSTGFVTGQMSGIGTIYVFFSQLLTIGMAFSLIYYFRTKDVGFLYIALMGMIFFADRIIIKGRRSAMAELFVILGFLLYKYKKFSLPRVLLGLIVIIGALLINSIGDYRDHMTENMDIKSLLSIDYLGNISANTRSHTLMENKQLEVKNAIIFSECAANSQSYNWGKSIWNKLVFQFFPGQIFGNQLKKDLMFNITSKNCAWIPSTGTTITGIGWTFLEFSYFGMIIFFFISLLLKKMFINTFNSLNELFYLLTVPAAMVSISHSPMNFFLRLTSISIFSLPIVLFGRYRSRK